MMKNIIYRVVPVLTVILAMACADDSLDPFHFSELRKASLLTLRGDAFDALNDTGCSNRFFNNMILGDEAFSMETEFLSENQDLLQEVRVFAKTPDIGRAPVGTFPGSAFTIPSGGTSRRGTITVTLETIKTALGLDNTDLANLKPFDLVVESDLILTDGTTVSSDLIVNSGLFSSAIFYPAQTLSYCAMDVNDFKPKASLKLRGKVVKDESGNTVARPVLALKDGATDTLYIKFDQNIVDKPTVVLSPNQGTLGNGGEVQTAKKIDEDGNYTTEDDPTAFFIVYTAPTGFTGKVTATVSGANSKDQGVNLVQNPKSITINVDNEDPVLASLTTGDVIGRNQFNEIVATFNEALATPPTIEVTGQGLDEVGTDPSEPITMTLDEKDSRVARYVFIWKDSDNPTNATHGKLTIEIKGGADGAGNAQADFMDNASLLSDVGTPPSPSVTLIGGQYDFGTQIRWMVQQTNSNTPPVSATPTTTAPVGNPGGSTQGTVFYLVQQSGDPAPSQKTATLAGVKVNDGFTVNASATVLGQGQSAVGNDVFADFAANGTAMEVYFYFISSTGTVSPISTTPLVVNMN